ncbi:MAG: sugar MFS transporter [Pyrinomonadaceae bacterium]
MYNKKLVFLAACLGMLFFGITLITLGSLATTLQAKFALDAVDSGTIFSILPFGILAGSFIFGPIADKHGSRLLLAAACAGMFLGFQAIAFADSLGLLKGAIFLFGLCGGVINGATNAIVADISEENRGANLSLLGVFFCLGALGMPLVLGAVAGRVSPFLVVSGVGFLVLAVGVYCAAIKFPPPKVQEASDADWKSLVSMFLLLISFFLFFQSSLEAIINNWTTTYVTTRGVMTEANALYALSLHIGGMTGMRLLMGSLLRNVAQTTLMWVCLALLLVGVLLMQFGSAGVATVGLVLSGAGLAGGFPIMLGFAGDRFSGLSGTAFSFIFVMALIGNMLINFLMGIIVHHHGVAHLTTVSYIEIGLMAFLFIFISRDLKTHKIQ